MRVGTKLLIVEGIMGSGKSTTVRFLAKQLQEQGIEARFIGEEVQPHPLRVDDVLPHPFAPWKDVSADNYLERSLQNWRAFVRQAETESAVWILDGQLFHGDLTNLLMMDASPAHLRTHIRQITDISRSLHPSLIYFTQAEVKQALDRILIVRGKGWEEYQVNWKTASPYCEARGLHDYEGWIQLYRDYRLLCDALFADLAMPKINIDTTEGDWLRYQKAVCAFLELPSPVEVFTLWL